MNSKVSKYLIRIVLILLGLSVVGVTLFLFLYVFWKENCHELSFILDKPAGVPIGTAGGIFPALMGSLYLGALAALIGGILGIGASAYLVFYHRNKYVSGIVNFAITGLSGIPSILFGLVGYTLLIYGFGISRSLLCASLCVSAMIVPFVAIRARKVFEEKGISYMTNSIGLGLSREYALRKMILPSASLNFSEQLHLEWHTEWERLHRFCIRVRLWSQMFRENLRIHLCHCRIICICW